MKNAYRFLSFILFAFYVIFFGCSKDSTSPETLSDQEVLKSQVESIDSVADFSSSDEATIDDGSAQDWEVSSLGKSLSPITPIRWGRKIDNVQRNCNIVITGDSIANATIVKTITGRLIIVTSSSEGLSTLDTLQKQFTSQTQREVQFKRIARTSDPKKNWKPIDITTVVGGTSEARNFNITKLEIYTPHDTLVISEPMMQWFHLGISSYGIPVLNLGDTMLVRAQIQSTDTNREYAMLRHSVDHRFTHRYRTRMQMVDSTGNQLSYTREYEMRFATRLPVGVNVCRLNVVYDVMSYNSINDDTAPFMNMFVGVPYIVKRY